MGAWSQQTLVSPTGLRNGIRVTSLLLAFIYSSIIEAACVAFLIGAIQTAITSMKNVIHLYYYYYYLWSRV